MAYDGKNKQSVNKPSTHATNVTVKYRDNVFCLLYRDKKNLLDLYNALNDSHYTDPDELTVTTLKGGVYMKYKNDASFVFGQDLYMFEQQSSKNPNLPLRYLHYVSDVYRDLYANSELHRKQMLKIPVPHFVTFYNGKEKMEEAEHIFKLSDMFEYQTGESELELVVRVININERSGILEKCETLRDYMTFVNKVRTKKEKENKDIKTAVTEAVDECIEEDILADFFREHRDEVVDVSIYEYDEEGHMAIIREEGYISGRADGEQRNKISLIVRKVQKGKSLETIASELEEDVAEIKPLYDAVIAAAPEYDIESIIKYAISNVEA